MKIYSIIALLPIFLLSATSTTNAPTLTPQQIEQQRIETEVNKRMQVIKIKETRHIQDCANIKGASGEIGCWQILKSNLDKFKKEKKIQVKGYTYELQKMYTETIITDDVLKKLEPKQTFKKWNSGNLIYPCRKGVNNKGVPYDSCEYTNSAYNLYIKIK